MRVAVIGANGQLGTDLCAALGEHEVVPFRHADFDVRDGDAARTALGRSGPEVIINTAAYHRVETCEGDPAQAFTVNAVAPLQLARIARDLGARLVHCSTDYVYGGQGAGRLSEDVPAAPLQVYGASKAAGEWLVLQALPGALVVRSSGLFGVAGASGKGGNFIQTVIRLAREKGTMRIVDDQRLSPSYTRDLAVTMVQLIERGAGGLVHVTNTGSCTWYDLARSVVDLMQLGAEVHRQSTAESGATVRRPSYSVLENGRLGSFGIAPLRHWQEAVQAYLEAKGLN